MKFLLALSIVLWSTLANAQTQRALLIGINKYLPPVGITIAKDAGRLQFTDLQGCRNDAIAMKSLLTTKFGFAAKNISELYDEKATREGILTAVNTLLKDCLPGDIAFIYYAGHGSQQRNSKSKEADKKDESIVPSDTWKKGVGDIRDKEFAELCNLFLDKGIKLTVILDCCHSGSMTRGVVYNQPRLRYLEDNNADAADATDPVPPESRNDKGFLVMSAAQDNEFAEEQMDENNLGHGAFTLALMTAFHQQSADASAIDLFNSTRVILKSNGKMQEPVLGGTVERQQQTLFGMKKGMRPDKLLIPVAIVKKNRITFFAGFAENIYKDNELTLVNDSVTVRIDTVMGINKCSGTVIRGNAQRLKPGMLFEITNWVSSRAPLLTLYIPPSSFSYEQVAKFAELDRRLKNTGKIPWINDLEKNEPGITAFFSGDTFYYSSGGIRTRKNIKDLVQESGDKPFFFNLPPGSELVKKLTDKFLHGSNIKLVSNVEEAQYILYGTIDRDGRPSYGFIHTQGTVADSLESMPRQTRNFTLAGDNGDAYRKVADSLFEYAGRLAKLRAWLHLEGPRGSQFPFHVELKNEDTHTRIDTMVYKVNDHISFHLVANTYNEGYYIPQKYVYVFAIDRNGEMVLGYPDASGGNVENKFPFYDNGALVKDNQLFSYTVTEPVGTDNFYLLACDEPIEDYALLFNQQGVRPVKTKGHNNPLSAILNLGNDYDGRVIKSPPNWKLIRLAVKTTH